jgi:hypothetical protein
MKKYFYTDGTNKFGPFTFEELKGKNISRETLVWFQDLNDWKPAGEVPELSELFIHTPPPLKKGSTNRDIYKTQPPKTWLLESILATLFCCLPFGIAGIVNAAKVESRFYAGDIEGAERASQEAGKWTMVSFWVGIIIGVIYVIITLISAVS